MNTKTVLVTGIGGNVGQGILRNLRQFDPKLRLIGTNTCLISAGNHLCDVVHEVPFSTDPHYVPRMSEICKKEEVRLIIPSTDFESLYLAAHASELPTVATSPCDTNSIFIDKLQTARHFSKHTLPFALTTLPSEYDGSFEETIVKPRLGRGSRGVHINPDNIFEFSDDEYIVQKLYRGIEITTTFYVTVLGELHGHITLVRELDNGTTSSCCVVREYDSRLTAVITALMRSTVIRGSCNLQSIVTLGGEIVPFEVNGRISGTNSIRSQFGFKDVQYTIQEYLYNEAPSTPEKIRGAAIRILMDVIYPDLESIKLIGNRSTRHYLN